MLSGGRLLTYCPAEIAETAEIHRAEALGTLVTKMGSDAIATNGTKMGRDAIAAQRTKYQSDKAAEHKKQRQNRCKQRRTAQKTMVKDTPTAPPAPYAVVTKRGVCTLTNINRCM